MPNYIPTPLAQLRKKQFSLMHLARTRQVIKGPREVKLCFARVSIRCRLQSEMASTVGGVADISKGLPGRFFPPVCENTTWAYITTNWTSFITRRSDNDTNVGLPMLFPFSYLYVCMHACMHVHIYIYVCTYVYLYAWK
jgi:hypothetical protein